MNERKTTLSIEAAEAAQAYVESFLAGARADRWNALRDLNASVQPGGIIFAGDSITEGYPIHELVDSTLPMYNRGVGSATTQDLLDNLDILAATKARKMFVLIGTNDLGNKAATADIVMRVRRLCEELTQRLPKITIYLQSIYPINMRGAAIAAFPHRNNEEIERLNDGLLHSVNNMNNVTWVEVFTKLADANGELSEEYSTDGLHLTITGYRKVTQLLQPYIVE